MITYILVALIEIAFLVMMIRWYRRRNKPVGDIVVSVNEDGTPVLAFDFDKYDHPKQIINRKRVVFKVVRAPLEDSS